MGKQASGSGCGLLPNRQADEPPGMVRALRAPLSSVGLMAGTLFLASSLMPSLLPRPYWVQGLLSGLSFASGYGLGMAGLALWRYLQLPLTGSRIARVVRAVSVLICVSLALGSLWQAARWQNSIRRLMGMEESPGIQPVLLAVIGALVFLLVLGLARLFWWVSHSFSFRLGRYGSVRTRPAAEGLASTPRKSPS